MSNLMWSPDGRRLYFTSAANGLTTFLRVDARAGGRPERVNLPISAIASPTLSRRGNRLLFSEGRADADIWRLEIATRKQERWIASTLPDQTPQYSPDGRRIAFASARSGTTQVWICDTDASHAVQLTSIAGSAGTPRWSPDGSQIVFDGRVNGNQDIYAIAASGGAPRRLTDHAAIDGIASWSRDGRWIYFASNRTGEFQVWKMLAGGGEAAQVTRHGGYGAFEAEDGKTLYYAKGHGSTSLWTMPVAGGEEREVLPSLMSRHNFSVTPSGIYFSPVQENDTGSIWLYGFASQLARQIATIQKPLGLGLSASPDGKFVLFTAGEVGGSDLMMIENLRW